jgi:hypothetical protein
MRVLSQLLPERIDNTYRGHKLALVLFGALVLMKGAIGLGTIFNGRAAATSADGIPLDTFTPAGADAFVAVFAAWGLAQFVLNAIGLLVLIRYRALIPFMFAVLLFEHLCRRLIFVLLPIARTPDAPGYFINLALVAVMVLGLVLALRSQDKHQRQ